MTTRLPAHIEVQALLRTAETQGGFGMVLAKGEADAGAILLQIRDREGGARLYQRMPSLDGTRPFTLTHEGQDPDSIESLSQYLDKRRGQDRDIWILELDIADSAQFIATAREFLDWEK